jgi:hypothetical protein
MTISLRKQLTAFLLLLAMFLAPLNSFAHDVTSGASEDTCACELLPTECDTDELGDQSDHFPCNSANDCSDSEDCCPDAAEPAFFCNLRLNISVNQLSHSNTHAHIPEVYLAIFVPPEN